MKFSHLFESPNEKVNHFHEGDEVEFQYEGKTQTGTVEDPNEVDGKINVNGVRVSPSVVKLKS